MPSVRAESALIRPLETLRHLYYATPALSMDFVVFVDRKP